MTITPLFGAADVDPQCSPNDARILTDRIKVGVEAVWQLIEQAYVSRAWFALGYSSWDDYCTREFGTSRLRLPREERQEVVASMREAGLSTRAIASAAGVSEATVRREIPTASNDAVGQVTGLNGKSYAPTRPVSASPTAAQFDAIDAEFEAGTFDEAGWDEPDEELATGFKTIEDMVEEAMEGHREEIEAAAARHESEREAVARINRETSPELLSRVDAERPWVIIALDVSDACEHFPLDKDPMQVAAHMPERVQDVVDRCRNVHNWLSTFLAAFEENAAA